MNEFERTEQRIARRGKVTSRRVTRYYVYGKGYASKDAAYQSLAKSELNSLIHRMASQRMGPAPWDNEWHRKHREAERQSLAGMFPLPCSKPQTENLEGKRHGQMPYQSSRYYCYGCRWDWIKRRAKEIQFRHEHEIGEEPVLALPARSA